MNNWVNAQQFYVEQYNKAKASLPGNQLEFLSEIREWGINFFKKVGFPDRKNEEWKYTNVNLLLGEELLVPELVSTSSKTQRSFEKAPIDAYQLTFVDGAVIDHLSTLPHLGQDVIVCDFRAAISGHLDIVKQFLGQSASQEHAFIALNNALMTNGYFIYVKPNVRLEKPIYIKFIQTSAQVTSLRNMIIAQENTNVSVIEHFVADQEVVYFNNSLTEVFLESKAKLAHYKLIQESNVSYHIGSLHAHCQSESDFDSYSFSLAGGLTRSDTDVTLAQAQASCRLMGLYLARGSHHIDHHTAIHHASKQCSSEENYKGIISDTAKAVFNGKVIVAKGAEKTVARQSNRNLLLSSQAEVDTKPQLEIFNDDVICTHGATIGELDGDAIYYLRSRGIDSHQAKLLLLQAFAAEITDKVMLEEFKQLLQTEVEKTLSYMEAK